jgi:hypothetical protein
MASESVRAFALPRGILLTIAAMVLAVPVVESRAQEISDEAEDAEFEEIVVTGSRLKRRDFNSPSPISTINSEILACMIFLAEAIP